MTNLETLEHGISRAWVDVPQASVRICVIHTPDVMDRAAIDYWAQLMHACFEAIPAQQPAYLLHDLQAHTRIIPRYVRLQAGRIYETLTERRVYNAFVTPDALVFPLLSAIRTAKPPALARTDAPIVERIFTDYDSGIKWLMSEVPQDFSA